jgi:hypothetical protein
MTPRKILAYWTEDDSRNQSLCLTLNRPIRDSQAGDPLKVAIVLRDEREVGGQSNRGNFEVG